MSASTGGAGSGCTRTGARIDGNGESRPCRAAAGRDGMSGDMPVPALDRDMTGASDEQLLKVVGLIDMLDRRGAVDRLLEPLRPRLAQLRPARPITLGRVLILPFEDLLVPEDEAWPGRRCFARSHLARLVDQVTAACLRDLGRLRARAEGCSMIAGDAVREIGTVLWPRRPISWGASTGVRRSEPRCASSWPASGPCWRSGPSWSRPSGSCRRGRCELWHAAPRTGCWSWCAAAAPLGETALQSVLELLLARAASPLVVLEPLRDADIGLPARARDAALGQLVRRRSPTCARPQPGSPSPPQRRHRRGRTLRLVADLDTLEGKWPVSADERSALRRDPRLGVRLVGAGIEMRCARRSRPAAP